MNRIWSFIKKIVTSEYVALVIRIYLGSIFIYASMSKVIEPAVFAENIAGYRIVPYWGLNLTAIILPWLEPICGFLLIIGLRTRATALILAGLLIVFTVFVILNILRGADINCGCLEKVGEPIGWAKVAQNTVWFIMTIMIFFFDRIFLFRRGGIFSRKKME